MRRAHAGIIAAAKPLGGKVPAAVLPEDRAAGVEQVHNAPVTALPDGLVVRDPQALQVPAAALPEERAADEDPVQDTPVALPDGSFICDPQALQVATAVPPAKGVAGDGPAERPAESAELPAEGAAGDGPAERPAGDQQAEDAHETTELVRYTSVFQVEKGGSEAVDFSISTAVPRMYVMNVIVDDLNLDDVDVYHTKVDAHLWHRRMGHCNPRALQQLADKGSTGKSFHRNIESGDCSVCAVGDSKRSSHPLSDRPRLETRLEIVSADVWGKPSVKSYGGCQSAVMFTDDASRMRFGFPIKTKDETAEALQSLIRDVADPLGQSIGTVHCDGGKEFKGTFLELCMSVGITVNNSPPYVPQGNAIAERGFGTIIGTTRKMLLGAPHLPGELWAEAFRIAIYLKNRTPTDVLGGKAPIEVWESKPLGKMLHIHEWDSLAFKHEETRFRSSKLAARAKKMYLVGYNPESRSYRLWDPAESFNITNSAEVSFREKEMGDVVKPKVGHDPFPAPNVSVYQPGAVESSESEDEDTTPTGPPPVAPGPRRSDRTSVAPQRLNLFTTEEDAYERIEHALVTGSDVGNIGSGRPGEVGYMSADPANYDEATRVVVQGFHEADTGMDKAAPVASMESVHLVVSHVAYYGLVLKQAGIKTAFLISRIPEGAKPVYVIPPEGFRCTPEQAKQVWRLKAWLYGLRLSPKVWNGTFHQFLLELGFVPSTADPCLCILHAAGSNPTGMKERFETVDLGDAKFILGMAIHRNRDTGTILLTQEAYTKAVLAKFGMADLHPTKTPAEVGPMSAVEEETLTPDEATIFRSATGSALYICRGSRPDIFHTILVLTKSMAKPGPKAWAKLKRLMRYLKGAASLGITCSGDASNGDKLIAYVDSDFAGGAEEAQHREVESTGNDLRGLCTAAREEKPRGGSGGFLQAPEDDRRRRAAEAALVANYVPD
ncbi:unnamed protein product [Ectocarpus sp. CCAP 1310/34]|nr:unnamed protein product [Ectocarpus sp. CCAP 1310/34]